MKRAIVFPYLAIIMSLGSCAQSVSPVPNVNISDSVEPGYNNAKVICNIAGNLTAERVFLEYSKEESLLFASKATLTQSGTSFLTTLSDLEQLTTYYYRYIIENRFSKYIDKTVRSFSTQDVIDVETIQLNISSLCLKPGEIETLTATVLPDNATDKTIIWSSSNDSIASVSNGMVMAISEGFAVISAIAGGKSSSCDITVKKEALRAIDLGLSVKWASMNVGATCVEDIGNKYAWGEVEPKTEYTADNYKWLDNTTFYTKYNVEDGKMVLDEEDDAACYSLGNEWRMPSYNEFQELYNNCSFSMSTIGDVDVIKVTSSINNEVMYLPVPMVYSEYGNAPVGNYWTSTLCEISSFHGAVYAWGFTGGLMLMSHQFYVELDDNSIRYLGRMIRPVYSPTHSTKSISVSR